MPHPGCCSPTLFRTSMAQTPFKWGRSQSGFPLATTVDSAHGRLCACKDAFEPAGNQPELWAQRMWFPVLRRGVSAWGPAAGPGFRAENAGFRGEEKEAQDGTHGQGTRSGGDGERLEVKSKTRGRDR